MFRCVIPVARAVRLIANSYVTTTKIGFSNCKGYTSLTRNVAIITPLGNTKVSLMNNNQILDISNNLAAVPVRTVTKFSLKRGKRKTVKPAIRRFFRLHWGGWIRPKVGRNKKLWKKSPPQKRRLRQHVFCNATQSTLLDKMVTKFWKKPKYYVDDPYAPYHNREEYILTRKKPIVRN